MRRAVKDGRISLLDGKLDPTAADAQWARNTRVRAGSKPADSANLGAPGGTAAAGDGTTPTREDNDAYWAVKARREKAEADMAELKLAEQRAELVRVSAVRSAYATRAAALRESILQIPARLAAVLAAETDHARCHDLLQAELHQVLAQLQET